MLNAQTHTSGKTFVPTMTTKPCAMISRRLLPMLLGLCACVALATPAGAVVRYVDGDAAPGGDGLSWASAYDSLDTGLAAAQSGDQIWVAAGTYVGNFTLALEVEVYGGFYGTETEVEQRDWEANPTILDGDQSGSVVTSPVGATEMTRIDGFTITNGSGTDVDGRTQGGGLYLDSSSPAIENNTVTGNSAEDGGGLSLWWSSHPTIANNTVTGNSSYTGGGLYLRVSSPTIANNTITGNNGSGLYMQSSSPTIVNNTITGNGTDGFGAGLYLRQSSPTIANNTITGNSASSGAGLYIDHSSPMIVNNTITGNNACHYGGGLYLWNSSLTIANTIVAFNSSGVYQKDTDSAQTLRYNCVFGNTEYDYSGLTDPTGIDGNISADPLLADLRYGNAHIRPDSPCVDAGNNADTFGDFDIDGEPRIQPVDGIVDIGSDESDGTVWSAGPYALVRVSPGGDDANDGSSWAFPKRTVQAGVDTASALGGEVWVQAGTYEECITLHPYTYVYGGFAGDETERYERDWGANATTLDGAQEGSVVVARAGHGAVGAVDGFTITNGSGTAWSGQTYGGGLYLSSSSPTIANNTITGNRASSNAGGLYLRHSSPTIANNTITGNSAGIGGGLYVWDSSATIVNNMIKGNSSYYGGGLHLSSASPTIANNTIIGNRAYATGGGLSLATSSPTIANTIIAFNSSGVQCDTVSTPMLQYNCVFGNTEYDYNGLADPTGTDGNISADPLLAGPQYGNAHIQPDSPCVDAGNNADTFGDFDIDGEPRIQPLAGIVDIGADESDGTVWPVGPYAMVRVSPVGDDTNDGSSWALAKRTVQAGIDKASALGGEVWVQTGTYEECITLHPYAYVYGGFAGDETERHERDWTANVTTLDGQQQDSVVAARAGHGAIAAIDGFTITNGGGPGLYVAYSSPTIVNNMIKGNSSYYGGGLNLYRSSPTIANNMIIGNDAVRGGGLDLYESAPRIVNNMIKGNSSYYGGGLNVYRSSPTIANNTIISNNAVWGGGLLVYESSPTIANTIVAFNSSGVYRYDTLGTPTLRHNCVYGNTEYDYDGLADPTGIAGNISIDPLLASPRYGNAHIQPDSPCVDAGNNADTFGDLDIDGEPRIQPLGGIVDIGADESDDTVWPAGPYIIVRVSSTGDDTKDGSSWASAKRTVQAGIDAASALGGDVWVQAGTFYERVTLHPHAHLYGGFAGDETERDQRDWHTNVTTLDGQQQGSVVTALAGHRASAIDGFTITNGSGTVWGSYPYGGGLYLLFSSPTIANNTITGNSAHQGGGLCLDFSSPTIANNTIAGNSASAGGGLYLWESSPRIANNTITGNGAVGGGGLYLYSSSPIIASTIVAFNSSGIYQDPYDAGAPTLRYNCVHSNSEYDYDGLADPTGTDGNISDAPMFLQDPDPGPDGLWGTEDDEFGDLQLAPSSPCIDAGDNDGVPPDTPDLDGDSDTMEPLPLDLAGGARFIDIPTSPDTGNPGVIGPPIVDMGAFEKAFWCGDGVVDPNEECDDGNTIDGDGCQGDCTLPFCGDGIVDMEEQCDDGPYNSDTEPDACRTTCVLHSCEDGVVDTGEECDHGGESATCDSDCTFVECGDGTVNTTTGEECDDGNRDDGDGCSSTCQTEPGVIPTVSGWGMIVLALSLLAGHKLYFRRRGALR